MADNDKVRFVGEGSPYHNMQFDEFVDVKRAKRMAEIDRFDPAIRSLIHDYGYTVVKAILDVGVTKPKHVRHIVETVLNEFSPTRGSFSSQGIRSTLGK